LQDALGDPTHKSVYEEKDSVVDNNHRYVDTKKQRPAWASKAIAWPAETLEEASMLPYATAAAASFFLVPAFDSTAGVGAALVAGYAAGALTFYLQHNTKKAIRKAPKKSDELRREVYVDKVTLSRAP
jgi:hypothetical protein